MNRPISFLILAVVLVGAALYLVLPLSKLEHHHVGIEAVVRAPLESTRQSPREIPVTLPPAAEPDPTPIALANDLPDEASVMVEGRISDASGAPLDGIAIEVESVSDDGGTVIRKRLQSDSLGNFSLSLLPQRQYQLLIPGQGDYAGYRIDAFTDANAAILRDIVLNRVELIDADGLIIDTNASPVADFELILRHFSLVYPERVVRSDSSGFFQVNGFPAGEWILSSLQSNYYRIKGLDLSPSEYRNLTLMIDRGGYHLSGWVRDSSGLPLADAKITFKSAIADPNYHSFSYRSTLSDYNGAFAFEELGGRPGLLGIHLPGFEAKVLQHRFESPADTVELVLKRE